MILYVLKAKLIIMNKLPLLFLLCIMASNLLNTQIPQDLNFLNHNAMNVAFTDGAYFGDMRLLQVALV